MPDLVQPQFKPFGACGCGCGKEGNLRPKPWRDGVVCVSRGCECPRCRGKRNRAKGDSKARRARKVLGLAGANTRHEELWGGPVRVESKAGARDGANAVFTHYRNARNQSEQARPIGDNRRFVAMFCPDGTKHTLYVIRDDDLEAAVFALAESWGFGGMPS
jgi:hypothetical protein